MNDIAFLSALRYAALRARTSRPTLVTTGSAVDAVYTDDGITVRLKGTAVGSGARGDEIDVQLDNRRRLRGVVTGVNTVLVT